VLKSAHELGQYYTGVTVCAHGKYPFSLVVDLCAHSQHNHRSDYRGNGLTDYGRVRVSSQLARQSDALSSVTQN